MAIQREVHLSSQERDELAFYRDHAEHPYVRERCAALLKIAEGTAPYRVARVGLLKPRDPDTVYEWLANYQAEGLAGLTGHQQGGNHRRRLR